jgi:hypothetical protein
MKFFSYAFVVFLVEEKRPHSWTSDMYNIGSFILDPDSTLVISLNPLRHFYVDSLHILMHNRILDDADSTTTDATFIENLSNISACNFVFHSILKHILFCTYFLFLPLFNIYIYATMVIFRRLSSNDFYYFDLAFPFYLF